jgi:N-acetylneuraminic acid mutarotase
MIARRFVAAVALAWLGLGCIDVGTIPAPGPAPASEALQWRNPGAPPQPSGGPMATLGRDTIMLDSGGTWDWDGRVWTQLNLATSPAGRSGHAMAALGTKLVVFGGSVDSDGDTTPLLDDTWEWDGASWTKLNPPTSPPARMGHSMATLGDKVVLFGGTGASGPLNDTWVWDGVTWTEAAVTGGPSARQGFAMATLRDKVVLFGGMAFGGPPVNLPASALNDTWEWDGSGWTRNMTLGGPEPRQNHAMATLGDKVILFGGTSGVGFQSLNDTWQWDGKAWTPVLPSCTTSCASDSPTPRAGQVMASREGSILLYGWGPGGPAPMGPVSVVAPPFIPTWEWTGDHWVRKPSSPKVDLGDSQALPTGFIADRHVAMAPLGERAVLWGDAAGTWEWDGAGWTPLDPLTSPPKRVGHAMAALGDKAILFGGVGLPSLDRSTVDMWQWDGTTWTRRDPPTSPPWRTGAAMATLGDKVILFGGGDASFAPLADTWEWDGTTWTKRTPPTSPPARYEHAMATVGNVVVLFGGVGETGLLGDTWTWDGATWKRLTSASAPAARRAHAMATFDDRIVLFGGFGASASDHDTWAFKGGQWSQILPTTYPPERGDHAMAAVAGEVVLVGGTDDHDTWLLGAPPPGTAGSGGANGGPDGGGPGGVEGGTTNGAAGAAAGPGGGAGAGGPGGAAGAAASGGEADSGSPSVECNDTRDCAAGLSCDVNHHCVGTGAPDAGAAGPGGGAGRSGAVGTINEPPCGAPASAMITSFDTASSLVDSPYTGADVGLTSPTISTASGALVITLDTGEPTTTYPYAFVGLPFNSCTGAGAYRGVKFKASGTLSDGCSIRFSAVDKEHAPPANNGTCSVANCYGSSAPFDLPATPTDVTILFASQIGGTADTGVFSVDPAHLLSLQWTVIPSTGGCKGTVTIDDLTFL